MRIVENDPDPELVALWDEMGWPKDARPKTYSAFVDGLELPYSVLAGYEPVDQAGLDRRWHVSVAHPVQLPRWSDLAEIVHDIRPGVVFCLPLPPRSWWINVHRNCLHAWEIDDEPLAAQWRAERQGDRPT